tara:strand:+ start:183 stop:491 length:309 start_codon:yes stop_codon:yes gene_type:complete
MTLKTDSEICQALLNKQKKYYASDSEQSFQCFLPKFENFQATYQCKIYNVNLPLKYCESELTTLNLDANMLNLNEIKRVDTCVNKIGGMGVCNPKVTVDIQS